ncbi:hypothetical protein BDV96DRAFT_342630 [Lophiotrema nucula]|uniref:Uncharacterized protein n=1 Tax=Lophiotrema nucula TaxID=690887 RepID=A0A6A5ZKD0_9PLEO|nr:hypothetical protein BDV96DRAFT_342630 [Lophiotrema nucula]
MGVQRHHVLLVIFVEPPATALFLRIYSGEFPITSRIGPMHPYPLLSLLWSWLPHSLSPLRLMENELLWNPYLFTQQLLNHRVLGFSTPRKATSRVQLAVDRTALDYS